MKNVNRLQLRPSHVISHRGQVFLMTDLEGFIGKGTEGYYYRQTRFLSRLRITLGQACHGQGVVGQVAGFVASTLGADESSPPRIVSINPVDEYSTIAYYVAPSPAGAKAGPDPDSRKGGGEIVNHGIELQTNRFLAADGLHLAITVTNHALAPARVALCWELDADFADRTEAEQGERQQTASVERRWHPRLGGGQLILTYEHPKLAHSAEINFSGPGDLDENNGIVSWELSLGPQRPVTLALDLTPVFCGERVEAEGRPLAFGNPPSGIASELPLQLSAAHPQVQRAWDRAVSDLASLALLEGEGEERLTPAGGVPKYLGLFGRDALMTSLQAGFLAPQMLRGSLALLAKWNATKYDDRFDEEPGRVLHQRQLSPLALLEKNPFLHYYGDYSAPGLFLIDQAWHLALTGDKALFDSMRDRILQTLEWMDRDGDRDGDGFYEYATKAGSWGEKNQGWKDSREAILYEDGRIVRDPIAVVEIQGCYYAAKQLSALAFLSVGEEQRGTQLLAEAERLKRQFNETFWMPEHSYFGLALDPEKKLVRTIAASPGQCLAYGIVEDNKAAAVADRLLQTDLFSGWGLRTLSNLHPAYNPFGYHLGAVWPTANAVVGFGLKRYGFNAQFHSIAKGIFDASELFEFDRLPEAIGGHARDEAHPHPGIYPDACSPQAWSASAVISLIHSMLGLIPVAPRKALIVDPDLPEWLPELTLRNIRVGRAQVALRFRRDKGGYTQHDVHELEGELRIHRPVDNDSGIDRFARFVREVVSR